MTWRDEVKKFQLERKTEWIQLAVLLGPARFTKESRYVEADNTLIWTILKYLNNVFQLNAELRIK